MLMRSISGDARRADADTGGAAIDAPPQRAVAGLALLDAQHLRIVEPVAQRFREAARIENHRSGDHRPGERPAPGLVDAADQPRAAPLDLEIRHPSPPGGLCHKGAGRASAGGSNLPERYGHAQPGVAAASSLAWRQTLLPAALDCIRPVRDA